MEKQLSGKAMEKFPDYKTVSVSSLIPYARNSRTHSDAQVGQIAASIKEFGFLNPIIVDGESGIIAGHGRVLAMQKLGLADVPVIDASHLTDVQRRAYVIADNKLALNADWDSEMLRVELDELGKDGFDIELTGFSLDEIADLQIEEVPEGLTDEDAVPEAPDEPVTVEGDVWVLGNHRLMCGDSTSIDAVEKLMDGGLADQFITDPPYNVAYEGKTKDSLTIQNDEMGDADFRQFLVDAFTAADTVMKEGAVFYVWHADLEGYNFRGACLDAGWKVRQCLIWNKNHMVMGRQDYHWKHEPCLYGWKSGAGHLWNTDRKQVTVLDFERPGRNGGHPTMKPIKLIEYQVLNNTKGQDVVLDLFGGSGTTLIACEKTNRHCRMMELDPRYSDVILQRWAEFTGKDPVREDGAKWSELKSG
jgi:site-specific DNA-methyltransferase (adenine-specific)